MPDRNRARVRTVPTLAIIYISLQSSQALNLPQFGRSLTSHGNRFGSPDFFIANRQKHFLQRATLNEISDSITNKNINGEDFTSSSHIEKTETEKENILPYNWKEQWYALTFDSYILDPSESAEATSAAVFNHPLVLWRDENGEIYCADDVCPHRAAALSEGRVRDGKLECLYHGWQFEGSKDGNCVSIPQLSETAKIPKRSCLRMREVQVVQSVVWVWMGDIPSNSLPNGEAKVPSKSVDDLDLFLNGNKQKKKELSINNYFQMDLPYDHSYLIENLLDPAHVPVSHDRTEGGGKRENAQPFEMELDKDSVSSNGFSGRFRNTREKNGKKSIWQNIQYDAPGIIRYSFTTPKGARFRVEAICMPLGLGRSRLLFRTYVLGLPRMISFIYSLKPQFLRNLNSCKVLEQDMGLISSQEDHFKRTNRNLNEDFLLLDSTDKFVGVYRRWLDSVGHGMPWFQGLSQASTNVAAITDHQLPPKLFPMMHRASGYQETRYHRHVVHCPTTRRALRNIKKSKKLSLGLAVAASVICTSLLSFSVMVPRRLMVGLISSIPIFASVAGLLKKLENCFYVSFKRRYELLDTKGI